MISILRSLRFVFLIALIVLIILTCQNKEEKFVNSLGIEFVLIPAGEFLMGESNIIPNKMMEEILYLNNGDYDEHPVHPVEISNSFYMSSEEITIEQFQKYRVSYKGSNEYYPYVSGISWYDAEKFCEWLSEREGKNYRLPTEAEWEYACRAGSTNLFWSGDTLPDSGTTNNWGLKNFHSGVAEWCSDWYGSYTEEIIEDPIGPERGLAKVLRGGGLDNQSIFYRRSANRASIAPNFPPIPLEEIKFKNEKIKSELNNSKDGPEGYISTIAYLSFTRGVLNNQGNHNIGFRIVQAPEIGSKYTKVRKPFVKEGIKQTTKAVNKFGPIPSDPYFRKRYILPTPPENIVPSFAESEAQKFLDVNIVIGLDPGILSHHHSPALTVFPNGDLFAIYYTSVSELTPDVAMIATRLRFGAEEWDFPNLIFDFADVDDHAPLLWTEGDTTRFFWGANKLDSGYPFQWTSTLDNGATWGEVNFPVFETLIGGHSAQPINSAFRDENGAIYVASDGIGPESILWKSINNGKTWMDNGGRSGGRHTSFVLLKNGDILGMGGKSSELNGYMPKSISEDKGRSWKVEETPFSPLGSNQRPTIIRLKSGRLFFAGDFQRKDGYQPPTLKERGAFAALSEDEGKTWKIKKLIGTQEHESAERSKMLKGETIGYSVARQADNGLIHLITSMNSPSLHFEFNEAWILQESKIDFQSDKELMKTAYVTVKNVKKYEEKYRDGNVKIVWHAGRRENGQYVLHGTETWFYKSGNKKYMAKYNNGKKTNTESFWSEDGSLIWEKNYADDGTVALNTYWKNDKKRTESHWRNMHAVDKASMWNKHGKLISEIEFDYGKPIIN